MADVIMNCSFCNDRAVMWEKHARITFYLCAKHGDRDRLRNLLGYSLMPPQRWWSASND